VTCGGRIAERRGWPGRRLSVAACCAAVLLASAARADPAVYTARDVALTADGSLRGRAVWPARPFGPRRFTGLPVRLVRGGCILAETTTDRHGAFVLRNVTAGLYEIVVDAPEGPTRQAYRVWTASAAPPGALEGVALGLGGELTRGQSPIPPTSISQAAVLTAIAVGAIAAPAIYKSGKVEPRIPASP